MSKVEDAERLPVPPMSHEAYVANVRLFLEAAGYVLTEHPDAGFGERWRAVHRCSHTVLTSGDLEFIVTQALEALQAHYIRARFALDQVNTAPAPLRARRQRWRQLLSQLVQRRSHGRP